MQTLAKEFKLIARNGISLFMCLSPALMAIVFILVFGAMRNVLPIVAVDASVDSGTIAKLQQAADVGRYATLEQTKARVLEPDLAAGLTRENGAYRIILQGNEGENYAKYLCALANFAVSGMDMGLLTGGSNAAMDLARNITLISVLLLAVFIGGVTLGLSIVAERESGYIHALSVSPMRFSLYLLTKFVPAFIISVVGIIIAALIMGEGLNLPGYLFAALCSILTMGTMIFLIGGLARNQLAAIGVIKLLMPVSLVLPISAVFVPDAWQFLYYGFPMYWQYKAIGAAGSGQGYLLPCLLIILTSIPWLFAALLLFLRNATPRRRR